MNNHISSNSKFVAIALDDATSHLTDIVDVDEGVFFCPRAPFQVDPQWRKWIGTLRASEFEQANLVLLASRLSGKPQVLDDENQELGKDLERPRSCNATSPKQMEGKKREGRAFEKPSHEQMVARGPFISRTHPSKSVNV